MGVPVVGWWGGVLLVSAMFAAKFFFVNSIKNVHFFIRLQHKLLYSDVQRQLYPCVQRFSKIKARKKDPSQTVGYFKFFNKDPAGVYH